MNTATDRSLIFLELNEINFDFVRAYSNNGRLPAFARLFERHGFRLTTSEKAYEELEPWIQWVTAHTGKTLAEHGVFRLGDIVNHDLPQVWEFLEQRGLRVGAVSPMNAKNRLKAPAFFIPDPWTPTRVDASPVLRRMYEAIAQAVNDNANSRLTVRSLVRLMIGFASYSRPRNWTKFLRLMTRAAGRPWQKAMFLDLLLADVFTRETARSRPHFATLFLNAAAHIQHHYLFCSSAYQGPLRNPDWYVRPGEDPVFEVYKLYDYIIADMMKRFPGARFMIGTGLHQNPHSSVTFYWRLRDHEAFLRGLGIDFESVAPRMSRDFLVVCGTPEKALRTAGQLSSVIAGDGTPLFEIDNRGSDLFVMFTYPKDIDDQAGYRLGDRRLPGLRQQVAFVALKNGEHDGVGYLIDTGHRHDPREQPIALASIPSLVTGYLLGDSAPFGPPPYEEAGLTTSASS